MLKNIILMGAVFVLGGAANASDHIHGKWGAALTVEHISGTGEIRQTRCSTFQFQVKVSPRRIEIYNYEFRCSGPEIDVASLRLDRQGTSVFYEGRQVGIYFADSLALTIPTPNGERDIEVSLGYSDGVQYSDSLFEGGQIQSINSLLSRVPHQN